MRIGFCCVYSWRPHVEHMHFLALLAQQDGHEAFVLTCDGDLPTCYARELRPERPAWLHCTICRTGGFRSYTRNNVASIGSCTAPGGVQPDNAYQWGSSSAGTLGRFESDADFASEDFNGLAARLESTAKQGYVAATNWIEKHRLEAIFLFNGRMDATRGILEACRSKGIRCVTVERTWFGDGLHIVPDENCLGLREISRLVGEWREMPLTRRQAHRAVNHVAMRFLKKNSKEWRAYNTNAQVTPWPVENGRRRILLTPGSRNEVWSHPDWASYWPERTAAFDAVMDQLNLRPCDVVLRCHPLWGEAIGSISGHLSEDYYSSWARSRGIHTIPSKDPTSTLGLIEDAEAIVVCGGSAALEAAIIGKQVIAVSPSVYQNAGFESTACTRDQLGGLALLADMNEPERRNCSERISRYALRFAYTMAYRVAQFVDYVHCINTTEYRYFSGADSRRLIDLIRTGKLMPDDSSRDINEHAEDEVLEKIRLREWGQLSNASVNVAEAETFPVRRRWMYRSIDRLRAALPRGDL